MMIPCICSGTLGSLFLIFQPESPRFLVSIKKFDEARKSFNWIARINEKGSDIADKFIFPKEAADQVNHFLEKVEEEESSSRNSVNIEGTRLGDLCKNIRTRSNLIFSAVIWCALIVNYYILAFYLKYFPGNIFVNSFSMAGSDILSYLLAGIVIKKLGLTQSVVVSLITAALGAALYLFLSSFQYLIPLYIVLCRVGNSMLLNIMYVTNSTLFPT